MTKRKRRSSRQGSFSSAKRARLNKTPGTISLLKYVGNFLSHFDVESSFYITAEVFLSSKVYYVINALDHFSL